MTADAAPPRTFIARPSGPDRDFIRRYRLVPGMGRSKADVRATYDRIAESYAQARIEPWPEVVDFITDIPAGDLVLDVGCGHGRHSRPLALTGHRVVGVDVSRRLLSIGRKSTSSSNEFRSIEWVGADATALPFPDRTFDAALSIAVLHHLPSRDDRRLALAELRRVLQPEGKALVSVWSFDAPQIAARRGRPPNGPDVESPWAPPDGTRGPPPYTLLLTRGVERESFVSR